MPSKKPGKCFDRIEKYAKPEYSELFGIEDFGAFGIWHLAFGIWHLAFGIWHLAFGIRHSAFGIEVPR
jgi:hypothetical protein